MPVSSAEAAFSAHHPEGKPQRKLSLVNVGHVPIPRPTIMDSYWLRQGLGPAFTPGCSPTEPQGLEMGKEWVLRKEKDAGGVKTTDVFS